jgi:hypothetical protein
MVEERLLGGERHHREGRGRPVIKPVGLPRQVPGLHRHVLRRCAVAVPVRDPVDGLPQRQAGGPVTEGGHHARHLVAGD